VPPRSDLRSMDHAQQEESFRQRKTCLEYFLHTPLGTTPTALGRPREYNWPRTALGQAACSESDRVKITRASLARKQNQSAYASSADCRGLCLLEVGRRGGTVEKWALSLWLQI